MLNSNQFDRPYSQAATRAAGYRQDGSEESRFHNSQLSALHMAVNDKPERPRG